MNTAFSTYHCKYWQAYRAERRQYGKQHQPRTFIDYLDEVREWMERNPALDESSRFMYKFDIMAAAAWRMKGIAHYFLAPGVADFCHGCVKEIDPKFFGVLPVNDAFPPERPEHHMFFLHFPAKERQNSVLVNTLTGDLGTRMVQLNGQGGKTSGAVVGAAVTDGEATVMFTVDGGSLGSALASCQSEEELDRHRDWHMRLILGFSLYLDAFPDAVRQAAITEVRFLDRFDGRCRTVSRCAKLEEQERNAAEPHWRRGHFRLLSSPRFTHKRFQTIFIDGMFVQGKAYEVLDDAPATAVAAKTP